MVITATDTALLRLLQLSSPALPVGAYAFSQGLEYAIETGWLKQPEDIKAWLAQQLQHGLLQVDLPVLLHLCNAWEAGEEAGKEAGKATDEVDAAVYWNDYVLACRETAEFRLAEIATGEALARLLPTFGISVPATLQPPAFLSMFALAATSWSLSPELAAYGYLWSWLENQVMAATKLLPLGQTQAQLLLIELQALLPPLIETALATLDPEPGAGLPGVALASCLHETQYSRLFRS